MATIEIQTVGRSAPPRVSDEFVLELRTRAARRPVEAIRPLSAREVAVAVRHAHDEGCELALDLSGLRRIVLDPRQKTARVQPGVTAAELHDAAAHWSLAALVERGRLVRASLLAAEVVLPDGELVRADGELLQEIRAGRAACVLVDATYRLHDPAELRR